MPLKVEYEFPQSKTQPESRLALKGRHTWLKETLMHFRSYSHLTISEKKSYFLRSCKNNALN